MKSEELMYMINQLSEENRKAIEIIVRNLFDPDYTKLTPQEQNDLNEASRETDTITHEQLKEELKL